MVWGENLPSGRERAIETLIDMEPQGSFYRAARVLEESVPQALLHRPNLVTKAALVEQAYSLAKHEIDQLAKYDGVFGEQQNACFSDRLTPVVKDQKDRILRHHAKILAAKRGVSTSAITPSPQLVAALRQVYGEGESLVLRSLLQSVMDHPAFAKDADSSAEDGACQAGAYQLESLVSSVCRNGDDSNLLHGLLISILSVVTGYEVRDANKALKEESDPTAVPPLQVGALLSVIKPEKDDENPWSLDPDLLSYLGQAAAAFEERIEIQKARLLARLDDNKEPQEQHTPFTQQQTLSTPAPAVDTPQPVETPQPAATPDAIAIPEDSAAEIDAAAAALSATVFEQIISAATAEDSSSHDDGVGDSSDSGSDHDSDYDESERRGLDNDSSSSSSSSSSSGVEPGEEDQQQNHDGDSDEDEGDDDDDMVLRQALALSLVEQSQTLRVNSSLGQEEAATESISPGPVTPGNETPLSTRENASVSEPENSPLPSIPTPPKIFPYASMLNSNMDSDQVETDAPYFDPAALNKFGTLPGPHVLVHLLRYTLETIQRRKFQGREESCSSSSKTDIPKSTIAGGIGCSLFPPNHPFLKPQKYSNENGNELTVSLQLLVSLFLLVTDRREDAIEHLKKALAQESRAVQEGDTAEAGREEDGGNGTPTSEEGDDPAIALALNYLDEDTGESKESLEAKGMRRKAAAAAHDAAALLKLFQRNTDSWKQRVKLFSHCTLLSMKCLRELLQFIVRRWLQERQGVSSVDCHDLLPTAVISKLSMGLATLSSTATHSSFTSLFSGSEEAVEEIIMPLRLYQGSLLLWGETVPILYPSVGAQVEVIRSLLNECSYGNASTAYRSLETLTALPLSDLELHYHRLQMLCRRLRVSDLLDNFVSSPACYLPERDEGSNGELSEKLIPLNEPQRASSLIALIGSSSNAFGGIKGELKKLYLALCHRCHVRILLWDGLFACTEPETDEAAVSLTPSPGDTVRVSANPSNGLAFDATKCSDSMAILSRHGEGATGAPNGSSVHQRASKVWGTVLSSNCYSPKTGVHRWAVRLDKCERGHVFVGVSTAQASMRTYVGGDKYGWGMIGTQALWHDRRKIRGDYGATFRTGSTIIVTLDTDAGTLSFSSWKDSSSSNSFSLDPMVQNLSSPRRHGHVGGTIEEWGVAFEGLPLDSRLYPAVGLYQRDDRVTLLTVESGGKSMARDSSIDLSGGLCYYPRMGGLSEADSLKSNLNQVQKFNDLLSWDGIDYSIKTIRHIVNSIREGTDEFLWTTLLPTLASALCLVPPAIPVLSERTALTLLPHLTKCILELERCRGDRSMVHRLFRAGLHEGKWVIRATGSSGSSSDSEEYVVDFSPTTNETGSVVGFEGTGVGTTGKSKNGLVAIFGTVKGSSVHFVEEWTDGNDEGFSSISSDDAASSCVVTARLSLDGKKFEGTYRNVQFGTTGQIAGLLCEDGRKISKFRLKDAPASSKQSAELASAIVAGEALLCLAHSHLCTIIGEGAAGENSCVMERPNNTSMDANEWKRHCRQMMKCLSLPLLSRSSFQSDSETLLQHVRELRILYAAPSQIETDGSIDFLSLLNSDFLQESVLSCAKENESPPVSRNVVDGVVEADTRICAAAGGRGSLSALCQSEYQRARRLLVSAFVHHCNLGVVLTANVGEDAVPLELKAVWGAALKIMEDGVRKAVAEKGGPTSRQKAIDLCGLYEKSASLFLSLDVPRDRPLDIDSATADFFLFFNLITCEADLELVRTEMARSTKRAILRLIPIREMADLLKETGGNTCIDSPVAIESLTIGIPRLLGRGFSEPTGKEDNPRTIRRKDDLGGHYLSNLPGASGILRYALQQNVHRLWHTLSQIAERAVARRKQNSASESHISIDSLTLSVLASFTSVMRQEDIDYVVLKSHLLSVIPAILNGHRDSFLEKSGGESGDDMKASVVKDLHEISCREVSRSVLRAVAGMTHVMTFQTLTCSGSTETATPALSRCLELLLNELSATLPLVENAMMNAMTGYRQEQSDSQWEKWFELQIKSENPRTPMAKERPQRHHVGRSGVNYLQEHGITQLSGAPSSAQKPSTRSRGTQSNSSKSGQESSIKLQGSFCHQFLSHWLHILVAVSKVSASRGLVTDDPRWMHLLFSAVGLSIDHGVSGNFMQAQLLENSGCLLPARYRSRILRLLLPLLHGMDPSDSVAQSLFCLAGSSSLIVSNNLDEDEGMMARELVSLLRHLHSPTSASWRVCINRVISTVLDSHGDSNQDFMNKIGVLQFFNGGIDVVNRGCYVLLKPPAAVPLSADQQSPPSSKSQPSSSGGGSSSVGSTPHHIVGNGTEGVVAGLCRADAAAGIVSSIDSKNGVCEVILLNRNSYELEEIGNSVEPSLRTKLSIAGTKGSNSSRHTLTVRALRSPLSDVVHAQEVPLFVDDSIPVGKLIHNVLQDALGIIAKSRFGSEVCVDEVKEDMPPGGNAVGQHKDGSEGCAMKLPSLDQIRSEVTQLSFALMSVRSSICILSDERILVPFLQQSRSTDVLSNILKVACPEDLSSSNKQDYMKGAQQKYLSSLPAHESRMVHLFSMLRGLSFKMNCLQSTEESVWNARSEEYKKRNAERSASGTLDPSSMSTMDGYRTPPVESGTVTETPPVLAGVGTSSEGATSGTSESASNRAVSQSTAGSENSEEDDDSEAAATAATASAHLREAAIAQMAELGLPRSWSELALRRTGGTNIEAAVHFCLERGGEMERLLAEERERERIIQRQSSGGSSARRRGNRGDGGGSNHLLRQLLEMGFPSRWCTEALAATGNNVDEALTWILTNGERLSAEDEGMEDEEDDDEDDDEEDSQDDDDSVDGQGSSSNEAQASMLTSNTVDGVAEPKAGKHEIPDSSNEIQGWRGSVIPLRFISGRSIIDPRTLAVSGLPTGGFSSVGTKGVLLTSGKWYYEAILETAGCLQIGWADGSFAGHCHADRGDGCGDGPSSWAYDGWRRYRWHATATEWGCRWKEGDIIGCLVDMDEHIVSFTLNGKAEEIGMGVAFSGQGFRPCGGVYACVSFNRREKLRLILGGIGSEPFKHQPPSGYCGVGEAVLNAVKERDLLISKEAPLDLAPWQKKASQITPDLDNELTSKRFLCDFSDGEHGHELMAWAHRYYGSDASVHLGSGRMKQSSGIQKSSSSSSSHESSTPACLGRRIEKAWSRHTDVSLDQTSLDENPFLFRMKKGYLDVGAKICQQSFGECLVIASLLARKILLHVIVAMGERFDPKCCLSADPTTQQSALRFWKMIEASASLRSAGWVGEAGAMAIAAEALGLGISSNDNTHSRSITERAGLASVSDLDDGMYVPASGIIQVLSSVLDWSASGSSLSTGTTLAASAEAAIGSDGGGGVLIFLLKGLQGAICKSTEVRDVVLAAIRRSVRLLAVVEYDGDDSTPGEIADDDEIERTTSLGEKGKGSKEGDSGESDISAQPDARLVSFLTGLFLSPQVEKAVDNHDDIKIELFEAWSLGMLSASLPWRMVCAFTAAGILNSCPRALSSVVESVPTLARFYGRLKSTVARRVWAERAAVPVCSRYSQAMIELLCSVRRAVQGSTLPVEFMRYWDTIAVDAATPLPSPAAPAKKDDFSRNWEAEDSWISSDSGWEIWTGTVEYLAVDWKTPSRSAVRTLMDGGDGPPMLREGCTVMRGLDWDQGSNIENQDGKDLYEAEKAKRDVEKKSVEESPDEPTSTPQDTAGGSPAKVDSSDPLEDEQDPAANAASSEVEDGEGVESTEANSEKKKKKKKLPSPKLPLGTVLSIEPWNGIPAVARRVRWHLTGEEGVYRYGGDGGRYDISHVEVNEKATRVKKRHPLPESAEQCAARHGFGAGRRYSVLLRLRRCGENKLVDDEEEIHRQGIMELPDFGAGILVDCVLHPGGAVTLCEKDLLYGSKDSGWEARFGHPSFVPGTVVVLSSSGAKSQAEMDTESPYQSLYEELFGSSVFLVDTLRNREDGGKLRVTSEIRLLRGRGYARGKLSIQPSLIESPLPSPLHFDRDYHAPSLSLSRDGRTVSCVSSDGRGTAFGSTGFTKGVHYWEVKLEQADIGSVFIGVAEKPTGSGSGSSYGYDSPPRLNRWHGWGFVNFRATYTAGAERIYGAHCHAGDTVGVLLDCDAGRISFFFDGLKYGEHILNDLGCAFENISPFGFNVDGCGSGGAGQGAPSGIEGGRSGRYPAQGAVRPRALWPVVGLRNHGDRVTMSSKWNSSYGVDGVITVNNAVALDEVLHCYSQAQVCDKDGAEQPHLLPQWFVSEAFSEYRRWKSSSWCKAVTRGSGPHRLASFGLDLDLDASPIACASASALLGLKYVLLPGDRVRLKRSAGRILELAEEAVVLGSYQGRLFYRIVSQKSEGGSLTEGGGRAWCWDESEVVDGLHPLNEAKGRGIELSLMDRFRCTSSGGLRIVYDGGAVVRSDLEIFDGSMNLGTVPVNTVISQEDVLERRVNSCGVVRYLVRFEALEGWISSRIRGGKEEAIVAPVDVTNPDSEPQPAWSTAYDCAAPWCKEYEEKLAAMKVETLLHGSSLGVDVDDVESFQSLAEAGLISGLSVAESDMFLAQAVGAISDHCEGGNALEVPFDQLAVAITFALASSNGISISETLGSPGANQVAAVAFAALDRNFPTIDSIMARIAILRSFNRRARLALPWLSLRPSQEGAAIFGGIYGHGASIERAGRYWNSSSLSQWVQVPSIASKIRSLRALFFTSVKRDLLQSITEATSTPTPLSHDEYELPREIRTVRINRLKARRVLSGEDTGAKRKHSVFAQLHNDTKGWGGAALRRGFVAKGHGGQKRAFKVKLIGEGVNDYSGPYREAFTDALSEVLNVDNEGRGSLGVLDPTPNSASEIGENRGLAMFSLNGRDLSTFAIAKTSLSHEERRIRESFACLTAARDEESREVEEALVFLGRIIGTAFRHGIPLDLPLPLESVWKSIVEEQSMEKDRLQELDTLAYRQHGDGMERPPLLWWQKRMLNSFVEGLSNVLPVEILAIFSGEELKDIICGNPDVDVDLLRRVVEYEGYKETDTVIQYFWDTLREFTNDERKLFLQFVWARNRLPMKESDFESPFKIQKDSSNENGDQALPSASTCFFSLALPEYSSKDQLKHKLLFAINNVTTMETDFQTNSAEIAEGYRVF